jgi:hypothetical protein
MAKSMDETLDKFIDENKMYHFEGDTGLKHLNTIAKYLGYREEGYRFGSSLEQFLSDCPGAQEAIINWLRDQSNEEWIESLSFDDEEAEEE